jgi:superfamily I DNA and RNA helicase
MVGRYIKRLGDYNKAKFKNKKVFVVYPSGDDIDDIVNVLRRDFDKAVPLSTKVEYSENSIIKLTEEQYRCIDGLRSNRRCLINGAAGTGKTILAIKNAKESVAEGKKVGFFCYNLLLERELKQHFADGELAPAYVGSLTKYIEDMLTKAGLVDLSRVTDYKQFYSEELPSLALDYLAEHPVKFDKIILDEAQDLLHGNYLFVIDALLEGGLKKGHWFFFGDFKYQTIYCRGSSYDSIYDLLEDEASFATFALTVNCRNSINVQKEMNKLVKTEIEVLNKDTSLPPVKYITFDDDNEAELLEAEIGKLIASGIAKKDITILSPFKFDSSVASKVKKYKISPVTTESNDITYSTIQGFKGLENSVIMLVDIQTYNKPDLMYVGMSRARNVLYVFETKHAKSYRESL